MNVATPKALPRGLSLCVHATIQFKKFNQTQLAAEAVGGGEVEMEME
jgi:hypothetical protein